MLVLILRVRWRDAHVVVCKHAINYTTNIVG